MVSIAVATEPPISADAIGQDFRAAGFEVTGCEEASERFFQGIMRQPPDLVAVVTASPSDMLLESATLLNKVAPCPMLLFTSDSSPGKIDRATAAGVQSYVIDGYSPRRLRGLVQVALARFRHDQVQGEKLLDMARDLRERRQIEQAKGLLMRSRGMNEAGAFELMRSLAMRRRLRLANVAEAVVALSIGAEAVNRSGQLRMLAQRIALCSVQLTFNVHAEWAKANLHDTRERIDSNIGVLSRIVADRGCEEDLARIRAAWAGLRAMAEHPVPPAGLAALDGQAAALTRDAETLTDFLESSGLVTNLRVVNLAGRQRMLGQQIGKLCLLLALDSDADAAMTAQRAGALHAAAQAFAAALAELQRMPIRTPDVDRRLKEAEAQWAEMLPFQRGQGSMHHCVEVCERLLGIMEQLTEAYEQAAQVLIGDRLELFEPKPARSRGA